MTSFNGPMSMEIDRAQAPLTAVERYFRRTNGTCGSHQSKKDYVQLQQEPCGWTTNIHVAPIDLQTTFPSRQLSIPSLFQFSPQRYSIPGQRLVLWMKRSFINTTFQLSDCPSLSQLKLLMGKCYSLEQSPKPHPLILQLGTREEALSFYHINSLRHSIILGLSWLKANNHVIDWHNHSLTFQPRTHMEVGAASHVATSECPEAFSVEHSSIQVDNGAYCRIPMYNGRIHTILFKCPNSGHLCNQHKGQLP